MGGSGNTCKPAILDIVIFNLLLPKLLTTMVSPTANPQHPQTLSMLGRPRYIGLCCCDGG